MRGRLAKSTIIALLLLISAAPALAGSSFTQTERSVSIRVYGSSYELEGWLFRPRAEGKQPLAVLAHGTCGKRCRRRADGRETYMHGVARMFAGSGYVAYAFNRIGYGGSDGYLAQSYRTHETHGGCRTQDYETAGRLVADQIRLVVAELAKSSFVDPDRVVVMGHSGGGLGAVALADKKPSGLLGIISASGARGAICANGDYLSGSFFNRNMTVAYHNFGVGSSLPALMLYAENDPRTARAKSWQDAFVGAGGTAALVVLPSQPRGGHDMRRWAAADWVPPTSQFLERLGLPPLQP